MARGADRKRTVPSQEGDCLQEQAPEACRTEESDQRPGRLRASALHPSLLHSRPSLPR